MSYDKKSFLAGIALGRQLKGWATGGSGGGPIPDVFPELPFVNGLAFRFCPSIDTMELDAQGMPSSYAVSTHLYAPATQIRNAKIVKSSNQRLCLQTTMSGGNGGRFDFDNITISSPIARSFFVVMRGKWNQNNAIFSGGSADYTDVAFGWSYFAASEQGEGNSPRLVLFKESNTVSSAMYGASLGSYKRYTDLKLQSVVAVATANTSGKSSINGATLSELTGYFNRFDGTFIRMQVLSEELFDFCYFTRSLTDTEISALHAYARDVYGVPMGGVTLSCLFMLVLFERRCQHAV